MHQIYPGGLQRFHEEGCTGHCSTRWLANPKSAARPVIKTAGRRRRQPGAPAPSPTTLPTTSSTLLDQRAPLKQRYIIAALGPAHRRERDPWRSGQGRPLKGTETIALQGPAPSAPRCMPQTSGCHGRQAHTHIAALGSLRPADSRRRRQAWALGPAPGLPLSRWRLSEHYHCGLASSRYDASQASPTGQKLLRSSGKRSIRWWWGGADAGPIGAGGPAHARRAAGAGRHPYPWVQSV